MRITLRQARLAAAVVVASIALYGIAGPALHWSTEGDDAPLHGLGLCLVLFTLAGSFLVPRLTGRREGRATVLLPAPVDVPGPVPRVAIRLSPAWLQRFRN